MNSAAAAKAIIQPHSRLEACMLCNVSSQAHYTTCTLGAHVNELEPSRAPGVAAGVGVDPVGNGKSWMPSCLADFL